MNSKRCNLVLFLGLLIQFQGVFSAPETSSDVNTSGCQEFRTRADRYVNFFALHSFVNEALDDEIFRYRFLVKGERDIYIMFTESDNAQTGSKCYEFGINTSNPPSTTFRTAVDGSLRVRTEEKVSLSSQMPMQVDILSKEDGDVQMFIGNKTYPILRFPDNSLQQRFVSFATRGNVLGQFYFNCGAGQNEGGSVQRSLYPQENAKPTVYISFNVKSISRDQEMVTINLHYNMTLFNNEKSPTGSRNTDVTNTKFQLPKLNMYSNNLEIARAPPAYKFSLEDNKITAITNENIEMSCKDVLLGLLYCNLAFGLDDDTYHLRYVPSGQLFSPGIATIADIKVFQGENSISSSSIPLKSDIEMMFKIDSLKF